MSEPILLLASGRRWLRSLALSFLVTICACSSNSSAPPRTLYVLTFNMPHMEAEFALWAKEFRRLHPGFDVQQIDRKGSNWAAYYHTQIIAGTAPDIIDTQGAIWLQYASQGGLLDLSTYLERDRDFTNQFYPELIESWRYGGKNYGVPLYFTKTLLFYNKQMFKEAGLTQPPRSFAELMSHARKLAGTGRYGFMTLNFDWLYWPLFAVNDIRLVTPDCKRAAFNTPAARMLIEELAAATAEGIISPTSWTGRWVEPNGMFAAGNVGMFNAHSTALLWIMSNAQWVKEGSVGFAQMPGDWSVPNAHALHISASTRYPEQAWDFIKIVTQGSGALAFGKKLNSPTGNRVVNAQLREYFAQTNPMVLDVLGTQFEYLDRMVANWPLARDTEIKHAFYPEIQSAILGNKSAADALASAERKVNHILSRPGGIPEDCG